jgi:hypothetical protein
MFNAQCSIFNVQHRRFRLQISADFSSLKIAHLKLNMDHYLLLNIDPYLLPLFRIPSSANGQRPTANALLAFSPGNITFAANARLAICSSARLFAAVRSSPDTY